MKSYSVETNFGTLQAFNALTKINPSTKKVHFQDPSKNKYYITKDINTMAFSDDFAGNVYLNADTLNNSIQDSGNPITPGAAIDMLNIPYGNYKFKWC